MNRHDYNNNPAFCPAPWTSIYIDSTGSIDNCCISNNRLGNAVTNDILDIMSTEKNQLVKQQMLDGVLPAGCSGCIRNNATTTSLRHYLLGINASVPLSVYNDNSFKLNYLDIRWTNICNSACVYCAPAFSSKLAEELNILQVVDHQKITRIKEFLVDKIKDIETVYLAGGEPMLTKENIWLLTNLYRENPDCKIVVNTNLSIINTEIFNLICKFKNVHFILSGEAIGERYNYIRYGSDWGTFTKNITTLMNEHPTVIIGFNLVYTALTTISIFAYIDQIKNWGHSSTNISMTYYNSGGGGPLDPGNLPDSSRATAMSLLTDYTHIMPILTPIIEQLQLSDRNDHNGHAHPDLIKFLEVVDKRHGTDSKILFPEVYAEV